jgi:YYY domain-containing protein
MSQVLLAFRWYLVVQTFGLAALPLCLRLFRHLPDRGYGVSKPLGLLLTGWAFWLLTTFGWTHNTAGGILVALALLATAGVVLQRASQPANQLPIHTVLATEAVFALAFAAGCLVRACMPRIQTAGGEKWMEIAFLRATLRSDTFPPHDPWLSGFAISYYYFGYVIVAMVTRLAAVAPPVAFNLGIATLFALACTGAFSLVHNLVAADLKSPISNLSNLKPQVLGGLLGPLLVAVMGNLEGLLEMLHARGIGPAAFWAWLDVRGIDGPPVSFAEGGWAPARFFWWWQASRVLQDYTPWGAEQEVIDEFPAFSFILGDMHPHVLALPFVLLALALALNLYRRASLKPETWNLRLLQWTIPSPLRAWEFLVYALCLGGLGFLNTWDFPIYLFVVAAAYALARLHDTSDASGFRFQVSRFAFLFTTLLVTGLIFYLPFWIGFRSQASGMLFNLFNATRLPQFLVMFGPLLFIAVVFVADRALRGGVQAREVVRWTLAVALGILGVLMFTLGLVVALVWLGVVPPQGAMAYLAAWLRGEPIPGLEDVTGAHALISRSLLSRLLAPWTALGLAVLLVTIVLTLIRDSAPFNPQSPISNLQSPKPARSTVRDFALLLFATGALLALGVEYVYLRDVFGTRMNTVFKFYFQCWVMWGVAGGYALADFFRRACLERGQRGQRAAVVTTVAVLLVAAGLIYPALAIPARAGEYGGPPTLDGAAYLAEAQPDDYAAIGWLNENVRGAPVVLEAPGDHFKAYVYEGRVSAHTGLPTLLGWAGHEHQWRGNYDEQARREPDVETLYTSVDPDEVLTLLDKYDISYVYVGPLERGRYPPAGLAKFAGLMETVYQGGAVTIYRRMTDGE